ncbi:MAG: MBL fold metallo-hydrolase [Clostridia bacterium]|nr:MBL fold metallo-hydrolase [Clostridia bacterium]
MSLTLTFVGTSHGVPDVDRYCSSTLVSAGGDHYFIDGGAPTADFLTRNGIPFESVRALFVTHVHSDHLLACLPMLSLMNWYYTGSSIDVLLPEQTAVGAVKDLITLSDCAFNEKRVRLSVYGAGLVWDDGTIRVTAIPTAHMAHIGRPSYAFLLEADGKRILFSSDMRADLADLPAVLYETPVDLFITECAHGSVDTLAARLKDPRFKARSVIVTHIHPLPEKQPQLEALARELPFPLEIARDGATVSV